MIFTDSCLILKIFPQKIGNDWKYEKLIEHAKIFHSNLIFSSYSKSILLKKNEQYKK